MTLRRPPTAISISLLSLAALATAMGIGRFAFTPLFPLMQAQDGLTLVQGAWLAGANYVGYLVGALLCSVAPPEPRTGVRRGLVMVTLFTLAMGATHATAVWLALRFGAGVASAYVLVGVSAWALPALAALGRSTWAGWVYAGVGVGIAVAGLAGLIAGIQAWLPAQVWWMLGAASALVSAVTWLRLRAGGTQASAAAPPPGRLTPRHLKLVFAYGSLGLGYIIPATFLPAMARQMLDDPRVFGLIWPVFGVAAAASTVVAASYFGSAAPRNVGATSLVIMAMGVLAPALLPGIWPLLFAAVCVGGTFMVATMAGMQEARRLAGANASRLMAVLTAAFALGQLAGPILVGIAAARGSLGFAGPSTLAAACLLAGAWAMRQSDPEQ